MEHCIQIFIRRVGLFSQPLGFYSMTVFLLIFAALAFILPLVIPEGKWLSSYIVISSFFILAIWGQDAYISHYHAGGDSSPGGALGNTIFGVVTILHFIAVTIAGFRIFFSDES